MLVSIIEITSVFSQNLAEISSGTQHNLGSGEGGGGTPTRRNKDSGKDLKWKDRLAIMGLAIRS